METSGRTAEVSGSAGHSCETWTWTWTWTWSWTWAWSWPRAHGSSCRQDGPGPGPGRSPGPDPGWVRGGALTDRHRGANGSAAMVCLKRRRGVSVRLRGLFLLAVLLAE